MCCYCIQGTFLQIIVSILLSVQINVLTNILLSSGIILLGIHQTNLILVFRCHSCLKVSGSWEWRWIFKVNCVLHLPPALESEPKDARHMKLNHYTIYYSKFSCPWNHFLAVCWKHPSNSKPPGQCKLLCNQFGRILMPNIFIH